jgi:hypothetical protein
MVPQNWVPVYFEGGEQCIRLARRDSAGNDEH